MGGVGCAVREWSLHSASQGLRSANLRASAGGGWAAGWQGHFGRWGGGSLQSSGRTRPVTWRSLLKRHDNIHPHEGSYGNAPGANLGLRPKCPTAGECINHIPHISGQGETSQALESRPGCCIFLRSRKRQDREHSRVASGGGGVGGSTEKALSALARAAAGPCFLVGVSVTECFVFRPSV